MRCRRALAEGVVPGRWRCGPPAMAHILLDGLHERRSQGAVGAKLAAGQL